MSTMLSSYGYHVLDMGVAITKEQLLQAIHEHAPDAACLCGVLSPSLEEIISTVAHFNKHKVTIPLFIGGATTSRLHTAAYIAPHYGGHVFHVTEASRCVPVITTALSMQQNMAALREEVGLSSTFLPVSEE